MKLTNNLNLSAPLFNAIANDSYSPGDCDISVTSLIAPPRKVALEKKHWHELTEDVTKRLFSFYGQLGHLLLERANVTGIAERRLSMEIGGWKISGGMDLYEDNNGVLTDYKFTKAWSCKDGYKDEWAEQLNCYAHLLRHHKHEVKKIRIEAMLLDWSPSEAMKDANYPQQGVMVFDLPLWEPYQAQEYMENRVRLHKSAREELPFCTNEERWARPERWAVMKKGALKATKLHPDKSLAEAHAAKDPNMYLVEHRPGQNIRCQSYCSVSNFCTWFQEQK